MSFRVKKAIVYIPQILAYVITSLIAIRIMTRIGIIRDNGGQIPESFSTNQGLWAILALSFLCVIAIEIFMISDVSKTGKAMLISVVFTAIFIAGSVFILIGADKAIETLMLPNLTSVMTFY